MTYVRITDAVQERSPADPGEGNHLWMYTTAHSAPDEAVKALAAGRSPGAVMLDHESMIISPQLGCYKCEEPFSRRLFHRKCTGTMEPRL